MSTDDAVLSRAIAREAGALVVGIRESYGEIERRDRARIRALCDLADREAHLLIEQRLRDARPDDALLSEEGDGDLARLDADRVWIVDPLDGTWEYGQGRADFAVHVALWSRAADAAGALSAGTIDLPAQGQTWSVLDDVVDGPAAALPVGRPVRVVVSRSREPQDLDRVVRGLRSGLGVDVEVLHVGSVGAKAAVVLRGEAELYLHDAGFHDWDLAAPLAVALHRGLVCLSPEGDGFSFNGRSTVQPGIVMATPSVAPAVRDLLGLPTP
ncbi:inositol monophosphatase family protein [Longivirga aurantiaca]|uniref:Inositol monophosphatase family protein n=1 Tax=Longivirga aurantiaca TaxID=1837743 RepID=A0ABW1SZ90_9ACTN